MLGSCFDSVSGTQLSCLLSYFGRGLRRRAVDEDARKPISSSAVVSAEAKEESEEERRRKRKFEVRDS